MDSKTELVKKLKNFLEFYDIKPYSVKNPNGVLPMGSLYEAALFLFFEIVIITLRELLQESAESMRARHTNLE